jgi:hypothetical protein
MSIGLKAKAIDMPERIVNPASRKVAFSDNDCAKLYFQVTSKPEVT